MQNLFIVWKTGKMETKQFKTKAEAENFKKENSDKIRHTELEKGATNMETTAKKFMDGNLYKGYYIVSAKKCEHAESTKGFSLFKVEDGQPIWNEIDGEILNMNLAKARVDMLIALLDNPKQVKKEMKKLETKTVTKPKKKSEPISVIVKDDLVPQQAEKDIIDDYLFSYIPKKHKDSIKAIYKDGKIYTAVLTNGKTVTNITNWDSFKRAIRRAIEG